MDTVFVGNKFDGSSQFNGYIQKIAIDPTYAYSSGTLTTITSGSGSFIFERDLPANDNGFVPAFLARAA